MNAPGEEILIVAGVDDALERNIVFRKCFRMVLYKSEKRGFRENNFSTLPFHSSAEFPRLFKEV